MKKIYFGIVVFILLLSGSVFAFAHCQIPCGIYDDQMRIKMIEEDMTTVEKSINEINKLSSEDVKDFNQIVRWIDNKDVHADKIGEIVTYYFMAQRLKPVGEMGTEKEKKEYGQKLKVLHEILFYAMKAKQSTDLVYIEKLRKSLKEFESLYFRISEKQ